MSSQLLLLGCSCSLLHAMWYSYSLFHLLFPPNHEPIYNSRKVAFISIVLHPRRTLKFSLLWFSFGDNFLRYKMKGIVVFSALPLLVLGWKLNPEFNPMTIWNRRGTLVVFKADISPEQAEAKCEGDIGNGVSQDFYPQLTSSHFDLWRRRDPGKTFKRVQCFKMRS